MPDRIIDTINNLPPATAGILMALFISLLRIVYDDKDARFTRILLESTICGALTITINSGVMAMGFGPNWAVFIGGTVGYLGSAKIRIIALSMLKKRVTRD